jgi:hypothetical protein
MNSRAIVYMMACGTAFCGFSASAATVVPYAGNVFVSQGQGFQKINGATWVKVGDAIMVSPDGLAQVHLDDGNVITVAPGEVLNIPDKARAKDAALPNGSRATADLALPAAAAPAAVTPAPALVPANAEWNIFSPGLHPLAGLGAAAGVLAANEGSSTTITTPLPASP